VITVYKVIIMDIFQKCIALHQKAFINPLEPKG